LSAESAYTEPGKVEDTAVIIGCGLSGAELGIYLTMLGKKVRIVEMAAAINDGGNHLHALAITDQFQELSIETHYNTTAKRIDDGGVWCDTEDGEKYIEGKSVIYAAGMSPLSAQAAALYDCAKHFHVLGDCVTPKNISSATSAAMTIARDIGRF
jgi:pyruvate/2-oxoglutarate dehydrogenase complex dihydrolipoamide dehydrogenase (E3) component